MKRVLLAIFALTTFSFFSDVSHADVVLTFDQSGIMDSIVIDQDYGDNVVSSPDGKGHAYDIIAGNGLGLTPNVEATFTGDSPELWTTGYGDLFNVLYDEVDGSTGFEIVLTADPGFEVGLFEFDMAAFGGDQEIPGVSILDDNNNVLWSVGPTIISGSSRNSFSTGGVFSSSLTLAIDLTGLSGNSDNIGIDNVHFGQRESAIPEPSSFALILFGIAGACLRRKRSNKRVK